MFLKQPGKDVFTTIPQKLNYGCPKNNNSVAYWRELKFFLVMSLMVALPHKRLRRPPHRGSQVPAKDSGKNKEPEESAAI